MRRYKKKELLETAEMLVEANEVIGRLCKSNTERALEILGQCQESAILLGNLIESKGDGYAELIEILENYCENIYQMSMAVSDEEQIRKLSKKIQKQLTYLNNKIRQEMPEDKKEVVFFPYKASMWDSLESVWMAADADEDTDAYVVPIPYYDKNPDGTFREMHYEGDQYPDYVPVTNYEEYDFEERRPDIIYIHNPYDEFNYVTSVHPRFYSKNLKKFTEKLVYIPYFILGEVDPDDDAAVARIKHFCVNEAVNNADKVIVQSEDMRQIYIKVLTEESGGTKEARAYWEKKIDGSGSPKVDKVLRTKKEELEIPEEWMKIILKPDGSWKKIIFYNTSVTALLQHDEQMLKKIESVFRTFQESRDEVALLWRPHPLMESTLISMRPELWEKYRKIQEKYREEGWGIYDDTADMNRAVVLSDAYYGDGSSIVQLCKKTNKPVMIQDADICNQINDILRFNSMYIKEKQGFFISTYFWQEKLFKLDLEDGKISDLGELLVSQDESCSFSLINGDQNLVTIMPYLGKKKAIQYDFRKQAMESIETMNQIVTGVFFPKCTNSVKFEDNIYYVMNDENWIIEYQSITGQYATHMLDMQDRIKCSEWSFYWNAYAQVKNKVYFPLKNSGKIVEFTLTDYSVRLVKEFSGYNIQKISNLDGYMWLLPYKGNQLIRWNIVSDQYDIITIPINKNVEYPFGGVYGIGDSLVLMPNCISSFYSIQEKNLLVQKVDSREYGIDEEMTDNDFELSIVGEDKNFLFYMLNKSSKLIRMNKKNKTINEYNLEAYKYKLEKRYTNILSRKTYYEKEGLSLLQYLKNIIGY